MHSYPFNQFFITNAPAAVAGAGTSSENIKAGELFLADRNLNKITADTASADLATLHVVMAKVDSQPVVSAGINVRNLRLPLQVSKYAPYVPQTYTFTEAMLNAKAAPAGEETFLTLRVTREDNYTTSVVGNQHLATTSFKNTDAAARKAALVKLKDSIDGQANSSKLFTTAINGNGDLVLTGSKPALEEVGSVYTPSFKAYLLYENQAEGDAPVSSTKLSMGSGTGVQVAELERSLDPMQQQGRFGAFPAGAANTASASGFYNTYSIRWDTNFLSDFVETNQRQLQISLAFATDAAGAVGAQEAAFRAAFQLAVPKAFNLGDLDTTDLIEPVGAPNDPGDSASE